MKTTINLQNPNQLQNATGGHVYEVQKFIQYLIWSLIIRYSQGGERVCDFGCGKGTLLELHYRNKLGTGSYIGLDTDPLRIEANIKEWVKIPWATFTAVDLTSGGNDFVPFTSIEADKVIALNLPADISRTDFYYYIQNFYLCGNPGAVYFIRLPKATDMVSEQDIQLFITTYFTIEQRFGIAGSIGDFKPVMGDWHLRMYENLLPYYSEEALGGFMSPFFPDQCQQNIWVLKRKITM